MLLLLVTLLGIATFTLLLFWLVTGDADLTLFIAEKLTSKEKKRKVVWITGASSGIGEQIAYSMAEMNCRLILSARRVMELERVKVNCLEKSWELKNDDIIVLPLDLTDLSSLELVGKRAFEAFQKIDIVINNAGRSQRAEWDDIQPNVDMECFTLNALGPVVLTRQILKPLMAQRGVTPQVIVVSSLAGIIGAPMSPSYTAAKHALNGYFRSLWVEKGLDGLKVTIFCPGSTYAPNNVRTAFTNSPGVTNGEILMSPLPRQMLPQRVAELLCVAGVHNLAECWVSKKMLVPLLCYISVLCPGLSRLIFRILGKQRVRRMRSGNNE